MLELVYLDTSWMNKTEHVKSWAASCHIALLVLVEHSASWGGKTEEGQDHRETRQLPFLDGCEQAVHVTYTKTME